MKRAVKEKWLADLRSGQFEQGRSHLRSTEGKYCCLGVLATQFADDWKVGSDRTADPRRMAPIRNGLCLAAGTKGDPGGYLSDAFCLEIGLKRYPTVTNLVNMNDTGKSFSEIALWIEKEIPTDD